MCLILSDLGFLMEEIINRFIERQEKRGEKIYHLVKKIWRNSPFS